MVVATFLLQAHIRYC